MVILIFLIITQFISISFANGDDDVRDIAQILGWVAVALFSLAIIYVIFYQLFIKSKKILPKNDKYEKRREKIKNTYLKVKKPLSYLHYFAAITAIIILLIHGNILIWNNVERTIVGLIAGSSYLLYLSMGILIKVVFKSSKKAAKLRKYLYKIHTQIIILIIVGAITITHLAM